MYDSNGLIGAVLLHQLPDHGFMAMRANQQGRFEPVAAFSTRRELINWLYDSFGGKEPDARPAPVKEE